MRIKCRKCGKVWHCKLDKCHIRENSLKICAVCIKCMAKDSGYTLERIRNSNADCFPLEESDNVKVQFT